MSNLRVLINGAGIAGPVTAYWLARTRLNASITIVERSPVPRVTGQAIDIRGPAIDIIKAMKLEEAVRERHTSEEGTVMVNSSGKPFAKFDSTGGSFTAEYEILRADLSDLFLEATQKLSNVKYKYGDYVTALNQTNEAVEVIFDGGSKETFDVVIGADGSTSKTRSLILDEPILKDSYNFIGQYIAFFSIPRIESDEKLWKWYNEPKGLGLMTRPHRNDKTVGVYMCITKSARGERDPVVEEAMEKGIEETKKMLRKRFENSGWETKRILEGLDSTEDFYMSKAAQVKLSKWSNGRAIVIGDAAHATFGIGTTLAIINGYLLAGELGKIKDIKEVPQALESYEKVFRPIYSKMEELPPGFPQLAFPQSSWGLFLRDSALRFVSTTKLHKLLPADSTVNAIKLPSYDWVDV